jgi:hypothetical protein
MKELIEKSTQNLKLSQLKQTNKQKKETKQLEQELVKQLWN